MINREDWIMIKEMRSRGYLSGPGRLRGLDT